MNQSEQKPLVIVLNEVKNAIVQSVNTAVQQYKLPCYLIEPILADIYAQVKEGARNELTAAQAQMNSDAKNDATKE